VSVKQAERALKVAIPVTSSADSGGPGTKQQTQGTSQKIVEIKREVIIVEDELAFFDATKVLLEAHNFQLKVATLL
jgi:hypothetical protein